MTARRPDALRRRIAAVKALLAAQLDQEQGADETEKLLRQLGLLEGLARTRRRRRSALWALGAVAVALTPASLLRLLHLPQVDVALVAETRAFVFHNGEASTNLLPGRALLREVKASSQPLARCMDPELARSFTCHPEKALYLNSLHVHAGTKAAVRQLGSCFELAVLEGGAKAVVTVLPLPDPGRPAPEPQWKPEPLAVRAGESVSFCPLESVTLHYRDVRSMMVGDRIGKGLAEQEDIPALSKASLSILTTASSETFLGPDIPQFGGLSNGVAVARLGESMELSLIGKTRSLTVEAGRHSRNLMPTRLDWVSGDPRLKAALTILAAIFGTVVAVRERWLGDLG